jgi:hypothetical protein
MTDCYACCTGVHCCRIANGLQYYCLKAVSEPNHGHGKRHVARNSTSTSIFVAAQYRSDRTLAASRLVQYGALPSVRFLRSVSSGLPAADKRASAVHSYWVSSAKLRTGKHDRFCTQRVS